jgi:hypothetical protein
MMKRVLLVALILAILIGFVNFVYTAYENKPITGLAIQPSIPNFVLILTFGAVVAVFFGLIIFYGLFRPV